MIEKEFDYIFCQVGNPSSGLQPLHSEVARMNLAAKGKRISIMPAFSPDIYRVRNAALGQVGQRAGQKPYQGKIKYDRLIWHDSDQMISMEMIEQLISHDVDIVAGWARQWCMNHGPEHIDDTKNLANCGKWDYEKRVPGVSKGVYKYGSFTVDEMQGLAKKGVNLIETDYVGFALMVVKFGVFEALEFPWFKTWDMEWEDEEGNLFVDTMPEDAGFCFRAREKGFKIYVDPTVKVPHQKYVLL
jgi:hypothetical protein